MRLFHDVSDFKPLSIRIQPHQLNYPANCILKSIRTFEKAISRLNKKGMIVLKTELNDTRSTEYDEIGLCVLSTY